MESSINYLAVVVAAVVAMILGSLWYSPLLFGKQWMRERGVDPESVKGMPTPTRELAIEFITSLLTAFVTALLVAALGIHALGSAVALAVWLWLGFYLPTLLGMVLWEKRSFKLFALGAGQRLVSILLIVGIVTFIQ